MSTAASAMATRPNSAGPRKRARHSSMTRSISLAMRRVPTVHAPAPTALLAMLGDLVDTGLPMDGAMHRLGDRRTNRSLQFLAGNCCSQPVEKRVVQAKVGRRAD